MGVASSGCCSGQGFRTDAEVERYSVMMEELCTLVADKYGGSLKAEHGTGRNVRASLPLPPSPLLNRKL